jgi:hypothetical protein
LISQTKGREKIYDASEQGAEEDTWTLAGDWRRLHNEELHNFYVSLNIIGKIKTRRMRWVEHVARMI